MFEKFISHRTPEKDRRNTNDRVVVASSLPNVHLRDPRPKFADIEAMEFWKRIFPGAMDQFKSSPPQSKPQSPEYNIRDKRDWQGIYQALENARAHYQNRGGAVGNLRFHLRKGADGIAPAVSVTRAVSEIAPGDPVLTPILGALVILMDAVKTSSVVRQQALQGLGNLTTIFADVELFLRTFPKDSHILNASLCLIITTLDTIERGIAFFMSAQVARMVKAVALGDRYGESLVNGLDLINQKCQALMREANKSTLYQVHLASQEASKVLSQSWVETKQSVHPALERIQNMIENLTGKDLPIEKGRREYFTSNKRKVYMALTYLYDTKKILEPQRKIYFVQ
ncbi:hypothetical protein N7522_008097 [Penicillium canescens]|nr:hypothetical protein N7522_008097 [Penicillium canescens]